MIRRRTADDILLAAALGMHLRASRRAQTLTQHQVAARIGLDTRGRIANWERGKRLIPPSLWQRLKETGLELPDYEALRRQVGIALDRSAP